MNVIEALEYCLTQFKILDDANDLKMMDGDLARDIAEKAIPELEAVLAKYRLPVGADRATCRMLTVATTGFQGETTIEDVTSDHYGRIISAMHRRDNSMEVDAVMLRGIRKLMGYVEDGSDAAVTLGQDDATKEYVVGVLSNGTKAYYGITLQQAITEALKGEGRA